jgi:hypothetical protein
MSFLKPAQGTYAIVTAGAPVNPLVDLPPNTHTIIVYNPEANDAFMGWASSAPLFSANIAEAVRLVAGTATSLAIGSLSARPYEATDVLWFDISSGSGVLYITYVNSTAI